jgi:SpoIID/LytB domain protein
MGYSSAGREAVKAQMAAIYTYAKHNNFVVKSGQHAYDYGFDFEGTEIHKACLEVLGISADTDPASAPYIDYNGAPANAIYFSSSAGKTASAESTWGGGSKYPYLKGGVKSPETVDVATKEITAEEMKKLIEAYAKDNGEKITLSENPAEWLEIVSHDSAVNENTGYVDEIKVGNIKVRGNAFRCYVLDFKIRSQCFTFEYIPA